jgi:DNA-binding SARP family transcriptional activator
MLCLHLFGSLGASWQHASGASEPIPLTARPGSLLAFLALSRGQFFTRGELIATLWGEGHESTVGSFNTTLWRLRKAVERAPLHPGELIACDHHGAIGMPHEAQCTLDVEAFEQLVAPALAKSIEQLGAADIDALRDGVARYTDDILAGFSDEWAMREREKQRRHHLNALGRLMQLSTLARDYPGAIGYAQQILDRDILREDIHCELMRLLLLNGQRALALRQFERCRDALRRELAIQPMRETMALYQQIAEHAVGHEDVPTPLSTAHGGAWQPASTAAEMQPSFASIQPALGAAELIDAARRHLALADEQLQRSLPLVTPPSHTPRSM